MFNFFGYINMIYYVALFFSLFLICGEESKLTAEVVRSLKNDDYQAFSHTIKQHIDFVWPHKDDRLNVSFEKDDAKFICSLEDCSNNEELYDTILKGRNHLIDKHLKKTKPGYDCDSWLRVQENTEN